MKWWFLSFVIIIGLPFYAYIMTKSITMAKLVTIKQLFNKENDDGKEEEGK